MGNQHSSEAGAQLLENDLPQSESIYSRPRINRLSKPRVGAPVQTPIAAALTRTLSSRALNSTAQTGGLQHPPLRRRADSVDALYRSDSRSQWYGTGDTETLRDVQLSRANSFVANGVQLSRTNSFIANGVQLSRTNSFIANGSDRYSENVNRRSWVSENNFQLRDVETNLIDFNEPPMTASSTDSSYHSASQSPVPPDPLIPVRRKSLLSAAAPGTATRPKPATPEAPTTSELQAEIPDYFHQNSVIAKMAALDLAGERCETPNELQLLGSLKKGSLFVTNGAPSPAPSSPELRSTSWGSTKRIPSLTKSMLSHSESANSPVDPPLPRGDDQVYTHEEDNDITPRKYQGNSLGKGVGQSTPSKSTKLDVRLDTLTPRSHGVRLVPPSPADENGLDASSVVPQDGKMKIEEQNPQPPGTRTTQKNFPQMSRSNSYAPTENPIYPSEDSSQAFPASRPRSQFSFDPTEPMPPSQASGLKRSSSIIVVGTVAETVPDGVSEEQKLHDSQSEGKNRQYVSLTSRKTAPGSVPSEQAESSSAIEIPYGNIPSRTGTDSGYSSTGSFFSRQSWRRSMHGHRKSLVEPEGMTNSSNPDESGLNASKEAKDLTFKSVPYASTDGSKCTDASSPSTPKKKSLSPFSERVRSKFSSKSTETTPNTTPTKNTPTRKLFSKRGLSFRRKSDATKKGIEISPEAPSTDSFQAMKGTLPFDGRSFNKDDVYALDFERRSPRDPHRTGRIPPPPMPVYSRRNSQENLTADGTTDDRGFDFGTGISTPADTSVEQDPYVVEAVAITCDSPITYQPQTISYNGLSTSSPGPNAVFNIVDGNNSPATSSSVSLPPLTYDESELPPMPDLPPPPVAQSAAPNVASSNSLEEETPTKVQTPPETTQVQSPRAWSPMEATTPVGSPKILSRTPTTPRSPTTPNTPIMQPTPSRTPTSSYSARQFRKVATPPPPTISLPTFRNRQQAMNSLRKSPQPAAFYPPSSFRPPSLRGRNDYSNGPENSRPQSSDGNGNGNVNNYTYQDNAHKRRSLGSTVLGGKARRSGESDRERWGVDLSDVPLVKAEDLRNGYSSYTPNRNIGRDDYEMDEREMFLRRNDMGILDYDDDDDDDEFSFDRKKKEKRGSFWRRRSKSRSRTSIGAS